MLSLAASFSVAAEKVTLDLSKATTNLTFDADNGMWEETYKEESQDINSQVFQFKLSALPTYNTWWGFTASNSANNSERDNYITYQFSNMAKGGIAVNPDGTVKLDDNGKPIVDSKMPYLVAYYSAYMTQKPVLMQFNDGAAHKVEGAYFNLTSYTYYSVLNGDSFAKKFEEGDSLSLKIFGVAADDTEKSLDVTLASVSNGKLNAFKDWTYVNLSTLGTVKELYFKMSSTDTGAWGMNTPGYFCMDKLTVTDGDASLEAVSADVPALLYNPITGMISSANGQYISVYNATGVEVINSSNGSVSVANLPSGVYIACTPTGSIKLSL